MESDGMLAKDTEEACRAATYAKAFEREVHLVWRKQVWSRLVMEHVGFDIVWRLWLPFFWRILGWVAF